MKTVVIIPTLDPDERLLALVEELRGRGFSRFIVVDDGSADSCDPLYGEVAADDVRVLRHAANLGKGAALKTALAAVKGLYPEATHVVTVDGDGQHLPDDVANICAVAEGHHDHVVIGVRDLGSAGVPLRSRLGNAFSSAYFKFDTGVTCPDTQTGLRAFPVSLIPFALSIPGRRYEYEMNFLTAVVKRSIPLAMIPIETVYDGNNEGSHFSAVRDSVLIYKQLLRFAGSSLTCSAVDLGLFALLTALIDLKTAVLVTVATVVARMVSGVLNFKLNRRWSFRDLDSLDGDVRKQGLRYAILFFAQMLASAGLVTLLSVAPAPLVAVKVIVDGSLFVVSYFVQRNWVFKRNGQAKAVVMKGVSYAEEKSSKTLRAA